MRWGMPSVLVWGRTLVLRYIEDFSQKETAERIGVAPGTAVASLNHARHALKTKLREK